MKKVAAVLSVVGRALDGLDIAFCAYDAHLRLLAFNGVFLGFFPEHRAHIRLGEHYRENLRRFYRERIPTDELGNLEAWVADGIERHRGQERPFEFTHRGRRLRVASLAVPGLLRVRIWRAVEAPAAPSSRTDDDPVPPGPLTDAGIAHLERVADGVSIVTAEGTVVWTNRAFRSMYGIADAPAVAGRRFRELIAAAWREAGDDAAAAQADRLLAAHDAYVGTAFELPLPGQRWVRVVEQGGAAANGLRYFLHLEVSELRRQRDEIARAQQRARAQERLYEELAHYSSDATVSIQRQRIVYASPAATTMLGWRADELAGASVARLLHPDDRAVLRRVAAATVAAGESECRVRALRKDGGFVWVEARARSVASDRGAAPAGAVVNVRDVTARKQIEEEMEAASAQLQRLADGDALTGLPNRRKFDLVLERECRRARRIGAPLAVVLVDIDFFKAVNDNHGHVVGDRVLRRVATVIGRVARRAGELAARYGGEEFGIVLPNAGHAEAVERAELLRREIEALPTRPDAPRVTVSCGVASVEACGPGIVPLDLVDLADRALYRAKHAGRNRVQALAGDGLRRV